MASPNRVFLDWSIAPLRQAAKWFVDPCADGGKLDLGQMLVVVPTARSRRQFLEQLAEECQTRHIALYPPETITIRHLPEYLYESERPFADELTSRLAWHESLAGLSPGSLSVLARRSEWDFQQINALASLIQSVHQELASNGLSCKSVFKRLADHLDTVDRARWQVLGEVQDDYYRRLEELGLWDQQAARNVAMRRGQCHTDRPIVLVGIADLNPAMSAMLMQVAGQVTALVFCSAQHRPGFDAVGGLIPAYWAGQPVALRDEQIIMVDRPHDQALAVLWAWRRQAADGRSSFPCIGVPDAELVPSLERTLQWHGMATEWTAGDPVHGSLPWRLMRQVVEFVDRPTFRHLAALVRHPDCFDFIARQIKHQGWLPLIDEFQNALLPAAITPTMFPAAPADDEQSLLTRVMATFFDWLGELDRGRRSPAEWATGFGRLLDRTYAGRAWPIESAAAATIQSSWELIADALADVMALDSRMATPVFARDFFHLLDELYGGVTVSRRRDDVPIELLGWLDLPWDVGEAAVVTGMNDHVVPSHVAAHPFLPDSLCAELGILDNERRLARDVYAMNLTVHSRRAVTVVVGRRNGAGDPLLPSRLLLATNDASLLKRSRAFFSYQGGSRTRTWLAPRSESAATAGFIIPQPVDVQPLTTVSVTMFRDYLKCPYRFYLKHVLRLQSSGDESVEMDAGQFGELAHQVLEQFGKSPVADDDDPRAIADFLHAELDRHRDALELPHRLPAVRIQLEGLRRRLAAFADRQAERRREGWRIVDVECKLEIPWQIGAKMLVVRGKIDRIDQHADGRLAVWDYKTSETAKKAHAAHLVKGEWVDLQLPLYRHLLTAWRPDERRAADAVSLGYILLPNRLNDIQFDEAPWSAEMLSQADGVVARVLQHIADNVFWPPAVEPPQYSEEFSSICQDRVFSVEAHS